MFKNYRALWLLLAVALLAVVALEIWGPVRIGNHELKTGSVVSTLQAARPVAAEAQVTDSLKAPDEKTTEKTVSQKSLEPDTTANVIMFIGDSMLEGLGPRLAAYANQNDYTLYNVMWYSSTSEIWGKSGKIASYVKQLHPDFIFICLGANELFVKDIETKRDKYVKQMVAEIGDIPFLWIGPPNWKPDTGINKLIEKNVPEGSYFKSDGMHFERSKDGAHPTRSSAIEWMDSVMRWMPINSNHPLKMDYPEQRTGRPKRIFVHQPGEQ